MYTEDGVHAQVVNEPETDGSYRVIQGGCRRLWDTVEIAYESWNRLGRPGAHCFCVVANSTIQFVSLGSDTMAASPGLTRLRLRRLAGTSPDGVDVRLAGLEQVVDSGGRST